MVNLYPQIVDLKLLPEIGHVVMFFLIYIKFIYKYKYNHGVVDQRDSSLNYQLMKLSNCELLP